MNFEDKIHVESNSNSSAGSLDENKKSTGVVEVFYGETVGHVELLGPEPTEEELETLEKVSDSLPLSAYFVVVVELAERFTYYGVSGVFQNYMQLARDNPNQPGGLGLGQSTATALSYFFQFWCYLTPVFGGLVADMWLGKYNTILYCSGIYVLGCLVLFLTSLPVSIDAGHAYGGLIAAMVIIGIGCGGIKANVSALIADQYTNKRRYIKTKKNGKRVIVDPDHTIQNIYMIFYWAVNVGGLSSIATTEMEKNIDFWAAYLLPFCFFWVGIITIILGRKKYIRRPPQGTPIPNACRVIWMMCANGVKRNGHRFPEKKDVSLEGVKLSLMQRFSLKTTGAIGKLFKNFQLDIARPSVRKELGLSEVAWTDGFVDQVWRSLIACRVFLFYPIYWVVYGQMLNNFVSQAGTMELHGIPNDLMQNFDTITLIVFLPIMGYLVYPTLHKMGYKMRPMFRITLGFFLAALSMAYAAIVQHLIYSAGPCYDAPLTCAASNGGTIANHVHVAVQTPAYLFIGLSEIFASVTGLEYAYTKAAPTMKSFMLSLFLLQNAFGSALGIAVSPTAVDPKLMWMYVGLCCATVVAGTLFWFFFGHYDRIEEELNLLDIDDVDAEIEARAQALVQKAPA